MAVNWQLVNTEVLIAMDFDGLIKGVAQHECRIYADELSRLEKDSGLWTPEQHECLSLVSHILRMMLRPDNPNEPYGPMFVFGVERSAIPADFPREQLTSLLDWAFSLRDPELRARLLDVMWMQGRSFPAAQAAVDAYIASALRLEHPKEWPPCLKRLERALRLAAGLGKGGVELKPRVLGEVEAMLRRHRGSDPLYLSSRLIRLLLEFKHGDGREYAAFALAAAASAESNGDFWRAKDYYLLAAESYRFAGETEAEGSALRQAAESMVKESELAYGQGRGAMVAASVLSDAVEAMRQAPGGRGRAAVLHENLLVLQKESVTELKPVLTTIDISDLVGRALDEVRDKSLGDAVFAFCRMVEPSSVESLKQEVHRQAQVAILGGMLSSEILNSRGRVVAQAPGLEVGADGPRQDGLRWRMFRSAQIARSLAVTSTLNPVREEILATHAPGRADLIPLIQYSPWIPPGHAESVVRALVAGFHGDMLVAGHLVPPQLEALVRHVVESRGGATSMLEPGGVQPERTLGALLDTPEARQAFGADGVFELQDLLIDPLGTNLRNEVAHGLVDDSGLFGTDFLYAWWLLLRYCALTSKITEMGRHS